MTVELDALRRVAKNRLGVSASPQEFQREGISFLYRSSGTLLADESVGKALGMVWSGSENLAWAYRELRHTGRG